MPERKSIDQSDLQFKKKHCVPLYHFRTSKAYNPFSSPPQYTSSHYRVNCISKPESDNTLNFNRVLIDSLYICMCAKIRCHTYHHNTPSKICLQHLSQTGHYMYWCEVYEIILFFFLSTCTCPVSHFILPSRISFTKHKEKQSMI